MTNDSAADFPEQKPVSPENSPEAPTASAESSTVLSESPAAFESSGKRPASARKIQANRTNSQKSTGPKTPRGKAWSRRNARRHGLLSREIVLPSDEERSEYVQLLADLREEHEPSGITEDLLVQKIANAFWLMKLTCRATVGETRKQKNAAAGGLLKLPPLLFQKSGYMSATGNVDINFIYEEARQRLLASTKGIQAILEGLSEIRAYLEANGKLSQELRNELRQWCGPCAEQMLSILSDEDEDEEAEEEKEPNTPEQIVEFLQKLEKEEQMLMTRFVCLQHDADLHQSSLSIPDQRADRLIRCDAHNSREVYRALDELEKARTRSAEREARRAKRGPK